MAYNDTAVFQEIAYNIIYHLFFYSNKNLLILLHYVDNRKWFITLQVNVIFGNSLI